MTGNETFYFHDDTGFDVEAVNIIHCNFNHITHKRFLLED